MLAWTPKEGKVMAPQALNGPLSLIVLGVQEGRVKGSGFMDFGVLGSGSSLRAWRLGLRSGLGFRGLGLGHDITLEFLQRIQI